MIEIASTTNPIFRNFPISTQPVATLPDCVKRMRFKGIVRKTSLLAIYTVICALAIWKVLDPAKIAVGENAFDEKFFLILLGLSGLAPFVLVVVSGWRRDFSPFTAPLYAVLQGVFFGFIAVADEPLSHGVAMQAICLTCCMCIAFALAYRFSLVRITDPFNKKFMFSIVGAVLYLVLASTLHFAGLNLLPIILHGRGAALCGMIVVIAGVTFISVYDLAAKAAESVYPPYMEWHAAMGLIVSLVWLYLEGLRIFFKNRVPNEASRAQTNQATGSVPQ